MPITCGFDRMEPIVCCPDMKMIVTPPLMPQDKNPIFPIEQTTTGTSEMISSASESTTETTVTSTIEPGTISKQSIFQILPFSVFNQQLLQNVMNTSKDYLLKIF